MRPSKPSVFSIERFRTSIRHFVVGRAAQGLATLVLTLLTVRWLDGNTYGLYMMAWGLVELGVPITSLGLLPAVQRFLPELAERGTVPALKRFLWVTGLARLALVLLSGGALLVAWPWLAAWVGSSDASRELGWALAALMTSNLLARYSAELLECLLEQRYAQTARALMPLLRLAGLVALWATDRLSLYTVLWLDVIAAVISWLLATFWMQRQVRRLQPDGTFAIADRDLWTFAWHLTGAQLLNAVANTGLLRLIVARTSGLELAGQFAFLQQLVTIGQRYLPSTLLANMIKPMLIARHAAGRVEDVAIAFGCLWKVNIILVWPMVPLMILAGDEVVELLSSGRVQGAGWALAWLLVGLAATAQNQIVVMALQVYRYSELARRISLAALLCPVLTWWGASFGLAGASAGIALALASRALWGLYLAQTQPLSIRLDLRGVIRFTCLLGAVSIAAWGIGFAVGPWWVALALVVGLIIGTLVIRPIARREHDLILRALGPRARHLERWARPD